MPIKILAVADAVSPLLYDYFCPERWQDVDLVLSAGDLPPEFLDLLASSLNVPVFYVRGNHDGSYQTAAYQGFEDAHGRMLQYRGLRVAGFAGSQRYNDGPLQYSETEMRRIVQRCRIQATVHGRPHIVLTHAPPAGIHDAADVCHRGFQCFRDLIDLWQPAVLIHGHVHSHYGRSAVTRVGTTDVMNAFPYRTFQLPDVAVEQRHFWERSHHSRSAPSR